jgi:hypothetical protein
MTPTSTSTVEFGLPSVTMAPGDHICALYFGNRERDQILMPFLRAGLDGGDKCVAIVDASEPDDVIADLGPLLETDQHVQSKQLEMLSPSEGYLRGGHFSTREMIEFFDDVVSTAISTDGYPFARITGEPTWLFQEPPGADEFIEYESELNDFSPRYPQVLLCLYDLERFGGGIVLDLMRTHPKLLLGGLLIENPHYMTPAELRASSSHGRHGI